MEVGRRSGGLSGAVYLAADRPSVVPNGGGPRAWAATGRGHARPATPPGSHRARDPNNAVRCCARANDVQANVYATPTVRGEMGSSAGDERTPRSMSTREGRMPTSSNAGVGGPRRRWGSSGGRRPGGTGGTQPCCAARRPEKRPGPRALGKTTPKPVLLPKRPQSHPCNTSCATP